MDAPRLRYLFDRYTSGQCSESEKKEFLDLINEGTDDEQLKDLLDGLWHEPARENLEAHRADAIISNILGAESPVVPLRQKTSFIRFRIAACLAFAILAGGATFYYIRDKGPSFSETAPLSAGVEAKYITLPDGSIVILKDGSILEHAESFDGDIREVKLRGEAFFDIAHDASRPFVVHTGKVRTTVLGTAFNIRAYPDQKDITVTVARGKVKVSDDRQVFAIVNPDQQITLHKEREVVVQKAVDSHQVTAWTERDIYFDDTTIGDALDQLEKRFQVNIALKDPAIRDCRFTATFVKGESIDQILRILCEFNKATLLEKDGTSYEIQGGECPR